MTSENYASAWPIIRNAAGAFRPPRRVNVDETAANTLKIVQPGGYTGFWSARETPYMVEPMRLLASRKHEAVVFAGPARSGKTMSLLDGWLSHVVVCDPGDMLIVQMTQDKARDYSKTRVDRAVRHSPELRKLMSLSHDDNTYDKLFRHGMWLKIGWPTPSQLASSDYRYVALTDYDRMPADLDGEGSPFSLGLKRTTTFLSRGMCAAESSPGYPISQPEWEPNPKEPHAAPPTRGILDLFNQGDRRKLYWQCPHCREWFQPVLENFNLEAARVFCPHCAATLEPSDKPALNRNARWVPEGITLDRDGCAHGSARESTIASFWMEGPAAAYQNWQSLASRLLRAEETFKATGEQDGLVAAYNVDWGRPYRNRIGHRQRSSVSLMNRSEETPRRVVPDGVRFLIATVDVQGGQDRRFVVQIHGFGVDRECWLIDRFNIAEDGGRQVSPASHPEDWDLITKDVVHRTYKLAADEDQRMGILAVGVDTGGEGSKGETSVTSQAYAWYRRIAADGLAHRVILLKGGSQSVQSRVRKTYPDNTGRKNRTQTAQGDVPIWILSTDQIKDTVAGMLDREDPGPGYLHIPSWVQRWWYEELTYEQKDPTTGKWSKPGKKPNEAFDLLAYALAVCIVVGVEKIRWDDPPAWARPPLEGNPLVADREEIEEARARREQQSDPRPLRKRPRVVRARL